MVGAGVRPAVMRSGRSRRAPLGGPNPHGPDPGLRDDLPVLAVDGLDQLGRVVDRRAPRRGRDLHPHRRGALRAHGLAGPAAR
ncbi:hypothetical protein [Ornithinimicrobium kibberense]|uniref:hypothetical protein n=1 Tax=Ornithinimicrobium kibberense TaxID=282060 RepID=UPI0036145243